jgi:hypothetical protein
VATPHQRQPPLAPRQQIDPGDNLRARLPPPTRHTLAEEEGNLTLIATEICKEFKQETVMVRDSNKNKVYFINDK